MGRLADNKFGIYVFLACVLAAFFTGSIQAGGSDGPDLYPSAAARIRPAGHGTAKGKNLRTGQSHEGDVLDVLQALEEELGAEDGPGGKIVLRDGTYVTRRQKPVTIYSGVHLAAASRHGAVQAGFLRSGRVSQLR